MENKHDLGEKSPFVYLIIKIINQKNNEGKVVKNFDKWLFFFVKSETYDCLLEFFSKMYHVFHHQQYH